MGCVCNAFVEFLLFNGSVFSAENFLFNLFAPFADCGDFFVRGALSRIISAIRLKHKPHFKQISEPGGDIAQAVCDKLGYELKVEDIEFDAIVNSVKSGKADFGAAGMTVTEDRKKSVDFTDPYTTAEQVVIVKK